MIFSVIIPTHNPDPGRLRRTLEAMGAQTLNASQWEVLIVDNASEPPLKIGPWPTEVGVKNSKLLHEPVLGLTSARRKGILAAHAPFLIFVDDDNLLAPDYLEKAGALMTESPKLGALGGKSLPDYEKPPEPWIKEFEGLLALRDLGKNHLRACWGSEYPECSPIGAGMVLRREAVSGWLGTPSSDLTDRRGKDLTSGGDNDIVLCLLKAGWEVAYDPSLALTHIIPKERLTPEYLARLNHGIQKTWMQVLLHHGICPWPSIPNWTVPLRKFKAWLSRKAWSSSQARIRWHGDCGHFEGRIQS